MWNMPTHNLLQVVSNINSNGTVYTYMYMYVYNMYTHMQLRIAMRNSHSIAESEGVCWWWWGVWWCGRVQDMRWGPPHLEEQAPRAPPRGTTHAVDCCPSPVECSNCPCTYICMYVCYVRTGTCGAHVVYECAHSKHLAKVHICSVCTCIRTVWCMNEVYERAHSKHTYMYVHVRYISICTMCVH